MVTSIIKFASLEFGVACLRNYEQQMCVFYLAKVQHIVSHLWTS